MEQLVATRPTIGPAQSRHDLRVDLRASSPQPQKPRAFKMRGTVGAVLTVAGSLLVLATINPVPRSGSWWDVIFDSLAWLVFLAGGVVRFWATLYIGGHKNHALVDIGPYSLCRHPLYVGTFLIAGSVALFLHSLTFGALTHAAVVYYMRYTVPAEEARLQILLGSPFDDYRRRVPRYWPRWSNYCSPATIDVCTAGLAREWRRALRWLWLPVLGEVLTHVQMQPWWPNVLNLP